MASPGSSEIFLDTSLNDILAAISRSIRNDIKHLSALAESENELNAMAAELAERYEELNLVYAADNNNLQSLQSQDSLRHLVSSCTEYLNVGMSALIIPEKSITLYDFNTDGKTKIPVKLIKNLSKDYYRNLQKTKQTVVINSVQEAIKYKLLDEIPHKLIVTPVQTAEQDVIGMLVIVNNNWKEDFTNSDRNLLHVMSKKVSRVIQATYDGLTGLLNKHSFEQNLKDTLYIVKTQGVEHALLNIDLDRLSVINDVSGSEAGDELLRILARTFNDTVRSRDIVARLDGDKFGVLLESCPLETAAVVAKNICNEIAGLSFEWNDEKYDTSVSIGAVPITPETESVAMILGASEMACNAAKERGVGQIVIYEQNDIDLLRRRDEIKWVTRIQNALRKGRFELYCQQIQSFKQKDDTHYEILLRMIDDQSELVYPNQFLPAAEHFHLMPDLDRWVIQSTIDLMLAHLKYQKASPCKVAINLSGQTICDEGFQEYICNHVRRLGEYSKFLSFEITESAAVDNLHQAGKLIDVLKNEGCKFALDDFGTGLSSFAYLKNLDVDFLKIDGSFVRAMVGDPVARTMVSAINQVGQAMGLHTIAEYAENDQILALLNEIGVDYAQGYGLSKPLPFQKLLQDLNKTMHDSAGCRGAK
jgi:diguanylate cyclase (GGDEF)-like protein